MSSRPVSDFVSRKVRPPSKGERVMGALFPNRGVGWPGGWSQDRLEQVLHLRNWTYVAITAIARKIGQIIPNIAMAHKRKVPGRTQKYYQSDIGRYGGTTHTSDFGISVGAYYHKSLSVVKPHEELEPVDDDHLLKRLIEHPNPMDTSFDLLYELSLFMELCGVAYLWAVPNGAGVPSELWVIPSHWVWPRTGGSRYVTPSNPYAEQLIQYYEIRPWGGMGSSGILRFPPDEVIMFPWKSPINKIDGYSTLSAVSQWIDTEESISKSRWSQFINQARPEFWVELGPEYEDPTEDQIERVAAKFMNKYQGEYNFGKPIFTPPGAKVTPLSFNPTEMSYFSSEEQIRDMILSAFSVPKSVVGISNDMTFGSLLAATANFCTFCINPRFAMLGLRLTKFLAPFFAEGDEHPRIWWDDCSPADPAQLNSDITTDASQLAITPNEIRVLRGRKPYENGGDDPMGNGPGGQVPIPLNTGDDLTGLADLIPALGQGEGEPEAGAGFGEEQQVDAENADTPSLPDMNPTIEEPNGPPSKEQSKAEMQKWDLWFDTVNMQEEWEGVKQACCGDVGKALGFAKIMELGRIDRVTKAKKKPKKPGTPYDGWSLSGLIKRRGELERDIRHLSVTAEGPGLTAEIAAANKRELQNQLNQINAAFEYARTVWEQEQSKQYVRKKVGPFQFSSTQFNIAECGYSRSQGSPLNKIVQMAECIPDEDLAEDGREDNMHVTVKYGLHTDDVEEVRKAVQGFGGVPLTLGKTSVFPAREGKEYDVVKIEVESKELRYLNRLLSESLEHTDTFPDYNPHITLAYVKPGLGEKYAGMTDVKGMKMHGSRIAFCNKQGEQILIELVDRDAVFNESFDETKSLSKGSCEPGETAAQTGCTPAEGGGGKEGESSWQQREEARQQKHQQLQSVYSSLSNFSDAWDQAYTEVEDEVFDLTPVEDGSLSLDDHKSSLSSSLDKLFSAYSLYAEDVADGLKEVGAKERVADRIGKDKESVMKLQEKATAKLTSRLERLHGLAEKLRKIGDPGDEPSPPDEIPDDADEEQRQEYEQELSEYETAHEKWDAHNDKWADAKDKLEQAHSDTRDAVDRTLEGLSTFAQALQDDATAEVDRLSDDLDREWDEDAEPEESTTEEEEEEDNGKSFHPKRKGSGSCKPGERSDLTGCTPADGGGGKTNPDVQNDDSREGGSSAVGRKDSLIDWIAGKLGFQTLEEKIGALMGASTPPASTLSPEQSERLFESFSQNNVLHEIAKKVAGITQEGELQKIDTQMETMRQEHMSRHKKLLDLQYPVPLPKTKRERDALAKKAEQAKREFEQWEDENTKLRDDLIGKKVRIDEHVRNLAMEALSIPDGSAPSVEGDVPEKLAEKFDTASGFFSRVLKGGDSLPKFSCKELTGEDQRAYYYVRSGTVHLSAYANDKTAIHEIGHHLETTMPGVRAAVQAFQDHRCGESEYVKMSDLVPSAGYSPYEITREDKFGPALGEVGGYYAGKRYPDGDTEILSMGVEKLYEDPVGFAQADPEYFAFVLGILRGDVRVEQ